ncbi:type II toxin-antitoxin system RelE/ParE family toxin [Marinospirillum sp.]|uniref:type II toxin-antitoxin system RelE/ParE family toxin n=1 Tax=Marinospirillum sp. TaxID=2183934 RepID=UPI002870934F|nr:type II toxin-antitoxin system RelE/ParE family toxin [Marinospirillum sp.]MDR9466833.1 type II toxin-antitoxin system RelE/ParE family toxin [Marinospirillum sp.]
MDFEVSWSPEAIEDLENIAEYISRSSEYYANAVVSEMLSVARNIGEFPLIGRILPELSDKTLRERFVYSYRLIYRIESNQSILIVAVIHGKRLLENLPERLSGR